VVTLIPQLVEQFNKLVRGKKDEIFSAYFRALDRNRDGTVDHDEFELAVKFIQPGDAETKLEQLFALFDLNKDGLVSHQEAVNVLSSLVDLVAELSHIVIDVGIKLLNEDIVEDMTWAMVMEYGEQGKEGFDFDEFKVALDLLQADLYQAFNGPTSRTREYPDLFDAWQGYALEAGCSVENVEKWWKAILHNYTLPARTYHNMHHLRDIFRDLKDVQAELQASCPLSALFASPNPPRTLCLPTRYYYRWSPSRPSC
jgi:Ca2+-binding EF-hand superfamily protein